MRKSIVLLFVAFLMFSCVFNVSALEIQSKITLKDTGESVSAK